MKMINQNSTSVNELVEKVQFLTITVTSSKLINLTQEQLLKIHELPEENLPRWGLIDTRDKKTFESPEDLRQVISILLSSQYVVIDKRDKWAGMLVGFSLANNIPFITVGIPENSYYGQFKHCLTYGKWRKFVTNLIRTSGITEEIHYEKWESEGSGVQVRSIFQG